MREIRGFVPELKSVYVDNDWTSERIISDYSALLGFTLEFNRRISGSFSTEEVAHELERIRKDKKGTGDLPKLGRSPRGPKYRA